MAHRRPRPFLSQVNAALRADRAPIPPRHRVTLRLDQSRQAPMAIIWFRTRGCTHDLQGECTVCNYGMSTKVEADEMVDSVRRALRRVPPSPDLVLYVSPSGSLFDDREVPPAAREGIFELARDFTCDRFVCESRPEHVTAERLGRFAEILGETRRTVQLGLESASPWVLAHSLNKQIDLDDYARAVTLLRDHATTSVTNIVVGAPFLSPLEAVEDAVRSVRWALAQGSDRCLLFPLHVKRATLLEWLWRRERYAPPSLWALVEVLRRLEPELLPRVGVTWYRSQASPDAASRARASLSLAVASPTTCPACQEQVIGLLDAFRAEPGPVTRAALDTCECACQDRWRQTALTPAPTPFGERVARLYEALGRELLGDAWWDDHAQEVLARLHDDPLPWSGARAPSDAPGPCLG